MFFESLFAKFVKLKFLCEVFCNYIPDVFWRKWVKIVLIDFGIKASVSFEKTVVNFSGISEVGWNVMLKGPTMSNYPDYISILSNLQKTAVAGNLIRILIITLFKLRFF